MGKINLIQQKIKELSGGEFQKLLDVYLCKKYNFSNIHPLGMEDGTNKPTKGIPDSYVVTPGNKYILIMYGSVKKSSYKKLKEDIESCLDITKTKIERNKIEKIICAHSSTNITIQQYKELTKLTGEITLEIIDLGMLSHDLLNFPFICSNALGVSIDSMQAFSIQDFIEIYNKKSVSSPLNTNFMFREKEIKDLKASIDNNFATIVIGSPGVGKTRLVVETCKLYKEDEYKIYCVKSNGASLQSDINMYIDEPGNYILFLDDINEIRELEYILSFIRVKKQDYDIKIVATVRDYAKGKILTTLSREEFPSIIRLKSFSNEQIKQFLQENYNIKHSTYIEQICKISQGNIRLAVMAAQKVIRDGFNAITSIQQLFKSYYGNILNSLSSGKDVYCVLFIIGFFGTTNYKLNEVGYKLLDYFNIDESTFDKICNDLYLLELIDKYENEILKISDQSFKDFIIYYVLIEQKYISLENLLLFTFPDYCIQIVNAINTILRIFFDDETLNYITTDVNKVWQCCSLYEEYYFVKYFSRLNLDKTLSYIQNRINNIVQTPYNINDYNIFKSSNNKNIHTFEVEVLSQLKRTQYCGDAIELLLDIFNRNPEYIHDVYIALSEKYSYDEESYNDDYNSEFFVVNKIWQLAEQGKSINETILLISLFKNFLQIEHSVTKNGLDKRSFIMQQIYIMPTENMYKLREFMWKILHILYQIKIYKPYIDDLIFNYCICGSHNKYRTKFINFDMACFTKYFVVRKKVIDFNLAIILYNLTKTYDYLTIKPNKVLLRYKENKEFMLLINLSARHKRNEDWEITDKKRKARLLRQICRYSKQDWIMFFKAFKKYEKYSPSTFPQVYNGLLDILEEFKNDPEKYLYIINLYFKNHIKTIYSPNKILKNLFQFIGSKQTKKCIQQCRKDEEFLWLKVFYEEYPEKYINKYTCAQLVKYMEKSLSCENTKIMSVFSLEKYNNFDTRIIKTISQMVCLKMKDNNYIVSDFLLNYFFEESAEKLVFIFKENLEILEELYFMYLKTNGDHSGYLFIEIFKKDANFWNKFTQRMSDDKYKNISYYGIFEHIWENENYTELIDIAINNMIFNKKSYFLGFLSEKIFPKAGKNAETIVNHQKQYISDFIQKHAFKEDKLRIIFDIIVYRYEDLKIQYVQELLEVNNNINIFKSIPLEQDSYSWSGSLIPLFEKRIKSIENIKNILNGAKYIQHRKYLDDLINYKKDEIRRERIREYIEEY